MFPPPVLGMSEPDFIDACELTSHKNELVYTRFTYSGIDEYWSLNSPNKQCKSINAELEIPDNLKLKAEDEKLFSQVHEKYWKSYLIIDAIGTFEDNKASGYGHLGSNNSRFVVKHIINVQMVTKK